MVSAKDARRAVPIWKRMLQAKYIYLMLIPAILYYAVFVYKPMYGVLMAFQKYNVRKGIWGSKWIGFANFERLFNSPAALRAVMTTLEISVTRLCIEFCCPIILAIFINEMRGTKLKCVYQTIYTFPHFLSWVIVGSIIKMIFRESGLVNSLLGLMGVEPINFLASKSFFRPLLYGSSIWKGVGWAAIIYMAGIAGISPELYEAAEVDGAARLQRIIHITLPGIMPVIIIQLILSVGGLLGGSFDQIYNLQNAVVKSVATTIDIYVYDITFSAVPDYGFSTAVGLFRSVINIILMFIANGVIKRINGQGLLG